MPAYDIAILGLGAMGSAAAYHCARRGVRVLGIDRFAPPHAQGSSHGETRIIREAYFEDPRYVPLVQHAYMLWADLERATRETLFVRTGGLMIGPADGVVVAGARASAEAHGLPFEQLSAAEVARRFPALTPPGDLVAIHEPRAGVLFAEPCVRAHLELAGRAGADLHADEPVLSWARDGEGFAIRTARGRYVAGAIVMATNAWLPQLLPGFPVRVQRQPLFWFEPRERLDDFRTSRLPIYIWEPEAGRYFYGFPAFAGQVKVAPHGRGVVTDPDQLDRTVDAAEVRAMRADLDRCMPAASGRFARAVVCMYANTGDGHFILDRHPRHERVLILSACSGHGFKFSAAIGEIAASLLVDGGTPFDLDLFRMRGWEG